MVASNLRWTNVPRGWTGHRLYDWGRKGLRSTGNIWIRGQGHRPCKAFGYHIGDAAFGLLPVGGSRRLLCRVKQVAPGEVWPVYERAGRFWARRYYIVPADALRTAREQLAAG